MSNIRFLFFCFIYAFCFFFHAKRKKNNKGENIMIIVVSARAQASHLEWCTYYSILWLNQFWMDFCWAHASRILIANNYTRVVSNWGQSASHGWVGRRGHWVGSLSDSAQLSVHLCECVWMCGCLWPCIVSGKNTILCLCFKGFD